MTETEEVGGVVKTEKKKGNSGRGFGSMSHDKVVEIAAMGGKAAQAGGNAHRWTSEEAQAAGRVGGKRSRRGPKAKAREKARQG